MSRKKKILLLVAFAFAALLGWLLVALRVPHAVITAIWPVHTYYAVRAELELDGATHVLEATGRCDWHWRGRPMPTIRDPDGWYTFHGGFLTKVLDDGRGIVIFPGKHCHSHLKGTGGPPIGARWRWSAVFNQPGTFFFAMDLATNEVRYPEGGWQHDEILARTDLYPPVLVLDDARAPQTIRYYPNPKEHMASDCASLRIKSYRVTVGSSGTITRRELEVPYLANLDRAGSAWEGVTAHTIAFSVFDRAPWLKAVLQAQPPLTRLHEVLEFRGSMRDWRLAAADRQTPWRSAQDPEDRWLLRERASGRKVYWHEIEALYRPPGWEVAWDRASRTVSVPMQITGQCQSVVTLYPTTRELRHVFLRDGDVRVPPYGAGEGNFRIVPSTQRIIEIEHHRFYFNPWLFEEQP